MNISFIQRHYACRCVRPRRWSPGCWFSSGHPEQASLCCCSLGGALACTRGGVWGLGKGLRFCKNREIWITMNPRGALLVFTPGHLSSAPSHPSWKPVSLRVKGRWQPYSWWEEQLGLAAGRPTSTEPCPGWPSGAQTSIREPRQVLAIGSNYCISRTCLEKHLLAYLFLSFSISS